MRYQFGTSSENYGGRRYLPKVFTEQGVAMLSAVIKSDIAIKVSIQIMETFIDMRKTIKFISDIIRTANQLIILIDNYIDESTLMHLTKRKEKVQLMIYTKKLEKSQLLDIERFKQQYKSLSIRESNIIHDRFLIIDNKIIFHLGASLKDLGKKIFAFSKINISISELLSKLEDANC